MQDVEWITRTTHKQMLNVVMHEHEISAELSGQYAVDYL